jgi:GMP reductase
MPPHIINEPQLDFSSVLIRPQRSQLRSRSQVFLERIIKSRSGKNWQGVPIVSANMDTTGTLEVYEVLSKKSIITAMHKFYTKDDYLAMKNRLHPELFMVSTGISDNDFNKLCEIMDVINCNWICIDIANGYLQDLIPFCKRVRERFSSKFIVAGNVVTGERVEELIVHGGVDIVKVGIGPGSACTTRSQTGVGRPQLSTVIECANAAHRAGGYIISDGGITCPGDMAKAFCAGADFVMVGGQFAGHDENPGEVIEENGKKMKLFYGMSSEHAMQKHYGGMNKYRSSEGRCIKIPYKGSLEETVDSYLGGIRSTCTYLGVSNLENISDNVTFYLVNNQLNTSLLK